MFAADRDLVVSSFREQDQADAHALILRGLRARWGCLDAGLNPDLDDIAQSYAAGHFVVARIGAAMVGAGGFLPTSDGGVQIHRVSVEPEWQRRGVGSQLVEALLHIAHQRGYRHAMLETTENWADAVAFWQAQGFRPTERRGGDLYFRRDIPGDRERGAQRG